MAAKKYYQGCLLAENEMNCYYFFCDKRGNCEQFKQFQKEKERLKNEKDKDEKNDSEKKDFEKEKN